MAYYPQESRNIFALPTYHGSTPTFFGYTRPCPLNSLDILFIQLSNYLAFYHGNLGYPGTQSYVYPPINSRPYDQGLWKPIGLP